MGACWGRWGCFDGVKLEPTATIAAVVIVIVIHIFVAMPWLL